MSEEKQSRSPGRTWIDTHLNTPETERLVSDLMELSAHPTGMEIQALVREMKGTAPSERSCLEWRNNTYIPFYLRSRRALAERITAVQAANGDTSAATQALLRQANLDLMLEVGATNPKMLNLISVIESRFTEAEQNAQRIAQSARDLDSKIAARDALIAQYERKEMDWKADRQKIAAQMDLLRGATPATADEVRAMVVAEVDTIMGIPVKPSAAKATTPSTPNPAKP